MSSRSSSRRITAPTAGYVLVLAVVLAVVGPVAVTGSSHLAGLLPERLLPGVRRPDDVTAA